MALFEHNLGEETLSLLTEVINQGNIKLVIVSNTNWVIENSKRAENRIHFNPQTEDARLRKCLLAVRERGWI